MLPIPTGFPPGAHAELLSMHRQRAKHTEPTDYVFPTSTGRRDNPENVRRRFLAGAIERANESLSEQGAESIGKLTPHG